MACRPSCTCRGFPGYTHNYNRMSDHTNWLELQYVNTDTFKTSGPMMHDIPDWILTQHNVAQNVLGAGIYACWHRVWVRVKETGRVSPLEVAFVSSWDFHLDLLLTLKQVHIHKCQKQKSEFVVRSQHGKNQFFKCAMYNNLGDTLHSLITFCLMVDGIQQQNHHQIWVNLRAGRWIFAKTTSGSHNVIQRVSGIIVSPFAKFRRPRVDQAAKAFRVFLRHECWGSVNILESGIVYFRRLRVNLRHLCVRGCHDENTKIRVPASKFRNALRHCHDGG